jgi:nitrogen regulatory protein PII
MEEISVSFNEPTVSSINVFDIIKYLQDKNVQIEPIYVNPTTIRIVGHRETDDMKTLVNHKHYTIENNNIWKYLDIKYISLVYAKYVRNIEVETSIFANRFITRIELDEDWLKCRVDIQNNSVQLQPHICQMLYFDSHLSPELNNLFTDNTSHNIVDIDLCTDDIFSNKRQNAQSTIIKMSRCPILRSLTVSKRIDKTFSDFVHKLNKKINVLIIVKENEPRQVVETGTIVKTRKSSYIGDGTVYLEYFHNKVIFDFVDRTTESKKNICNEIHKDICTYVINYFL